MSSITAPSWERNWGRLTPFFAYPPAIRKVVYTTNAIESLNYSLRKTIKGRDAFPHDDAIKKLLYLGLRNASKKWTMPIRDWKAALNQFIILFGDRYLSGMKRPFTQKSGYPRISGCRIRQRKNESISGHYPAPVNPVCQRRRGGVLAGCDKYQNRAGQA